MEKKEKSYLNVWLKRTARELSVSGRLSEIALILSQKKGGKLEDWTGDLRDILEEKREPSFDLLTEIDSILVGQSKLAKKPYKHLELFDEHEKDDPLRK